MLPSQLPDPELVKAFNHTVRRHFAAQIAREREEAEVRRGAVVPLVRQAVARARAEGRCERVWLFGSYAWGEPGDRSDVDILVEGCADSIALASLIGRACERDVHVIDGADALDSLRGRVSAEGLPL